MLIEKTLLKYGFDPNQMSYTHDQGYMSIVDLIKELINLKCFEQRQLCADNAEIEKRTFVEGSEEYSSITDVEFDTRHHRFILDKHSILNAPEPKL